MILRAVVAGFLLLAPLSAYGTTWDEPWMDEVLRDADSFVKIKVVESKPEQLTARVTKRLAGARTPEEIRVVGFSLLQIGSTTAGIKNSELAMGFNPQLEYYLFLKKGKKEGEYLIATPTTGWAKIIKSGVNATYRHSYHQAIVSEDVYETTMTAIFARIHGEKIDETKVRAFMKEQLSQEPALVEKSQGDKDVIAKFCLQHAALETFRYLGREEDLPRIDPFLKADDFHVQISAVRAISRITSDGVKKRLIEFIEADRRGFAKVMAVWGLEDLDAREMEARLKKFVNEGKDEETGFGGNLMDPRVGTHFPKSVKTAVERLLAVWAGDPAAKPARGRVDPSRLPAGRDRK